MDNRRKFLLKLSSSALLASSMNRALFAQNQTGIKRFIIIVNPLGVNPNTWKINAGNLQRQTIAQHDQLSPLADHWEDMGYIWGLTGQKVPYAHFGTPCMFTGRDDYSGPKEKQKIRAKSASMDVIAGEKLFQPNQHRFASLHVGIGVKESRRSHEQGHISFKKDGSFVDMIHSPRRFRETAFNGIVTDTGDDTAQNSEQLKEQQVLELSIIKNEAARINANLGKAEKVLLDQHIAALEEEIAAIQNFNPVAIEGCQLPENMADPANIRQESQQYMQLLTQAMACNIAPAYSLFFSGCGGNGKQFSSINVSDMDHHAISHSLGNDNSRKNMSAIIRFYGEQVASLINQMKNAPAPDVPGANLFDNAVVIWANTLFDGEAHSKNNMPFVYLAGKNTGIQRGKAFDASGNIGKAFLTLGSAVDSSITQFGTTNSKIGGILI